MRVLVVEDDRSMAGFIQNGLQREGHAVDVLYEGSGAGEHVWDIHFDSVSNVVEVHINSLRNKIDRGFTTPLIHTVRGVGYILTASPI